MRRAPVDGGGGSGDTRDVLLEAGAGVLAKAVATRLSGDRAVDLIKSRQDRQALERAVEEAWRATVEQHRAVLSRYDVNAGFLEHEGAEEIARVLLAGRGPDARVMARACVRSLPGAGTHGSDALVASFEALLGELVGQLSDHGPFRRVYTRSRRRDLIVLARSTSVNSWSGWSAAWSSCRRLVSGRPSTCSSRWEMCSLSQWSCVNSAREGS